MFRCERIFMHSNPSIGRNEWFFNAREGVYGPFLSKEEASHSLEEFIKHKIERNDDGGRSVVNGDLPSMTFIRFASI